MFCYSRHEESAALRHSVLLNETHRPSHHVTSHHIAPYNITPQRHLTTSPSQCTPSSYQCMEATPSLACANKCVFCWRHHKNPVGTEWRYVHPSTYEQLLACYGLCFICFFRSCAHSSYFFYLPSSLT
jgi:hypothetical protein